MSAHYDPFSPAESTSGRSLQELRLKVYLAHLQMEVEEKARSQETHLKLEIKRLAVEAHKDVQL